jgi:hypothetical protein
MPFAFSTSALLLPDLYSTLRPKFEAQDWAMLHGAIINFRRRIVNQTPGFSCRVAAQFNKPDAANPAIASLFHAGRHWRGVADPGR